MLGQPRTPRRAARHLPSRAFALAVAFVVLLFAPSALADASDAAPMCDGTAASVEAPVPSIPANGGSIDALPSSCGNVVAIDEARDERASSFEAPPPPDRGALAGDPEPRSPRAGTQPVPPAARASDRPGFSPDVFRPPRR